jgi:hypothetical protein
MKTAGAIFQGAEQGLKEAQYRLFSSGHQPKGTNDATRACLGTGACPKCLQFQFLHLKSNWQAGTRFVPDTQRVITKSYCKRTLRGFYSRCDNLQSAIVKGCHALSPYADATPKPATVRKWRGHALHRTKEEPLRI